MNILEAAKRAAEQKRVFSPVGYELEIFDKHGTVRYLYSGEPFVFTIKDILSDKWSVVNE